MLEHNIRVSAQIETIVSLEKFAEVDGSFQINTDEHPYCYISYGMCFSETTSYWWCVLYSEGSKSTSTWHNPRKKLLFSGNQACQLSRNTLYYGFS